MHRFKLESSKNTELPQYQFCLSCLLCPPFVVWGRFDTTVSPNFGEFSSKIEIFSKWGEALPSRREWGEALCSRREFRNPGCPKGLRNPNNGGTIFGPLSDLCIDWSSNPAKIRNGRNINFIYLASCVLLLLPEVDLIQEPAQTLANFHRKSRFFESCRGWSRIIQEPSKSHLDVFWAL